MIEIMFGESEGGSMKAAKNYKKPDYNKGTISWFGKKPDKEEFEKMFDGKAVGGNSSEVLCIPLLLDSGDLSLPVDGEYRKNLILEMYTMNVQDDERTLKWLEEAWNKYMQAIEKLKDFAARGEELRIWYSDAPYSLCGFYHLCSLLSGHDCKVSAVKLPQYILLPDNIIQSFTSWGEIDAGKFYQFLPLEKELSSCEIRSFSSKWADLKADSSQLRAVVNGMVIGVPEDFYDHLIKKELPDGEFVMARLIGNIIGKYPLGVGDWWYAKRINKMIEQGKIKVVQKHKVLYHQVLKKI